MALLDADDLAYMRDTQTEARFREAVLVSRTEEPDGAGGTTTADGAEVAVTLRVNTRDHRTPETIVAQHAGNVVTLTMDHDVAVRDGDKVRVSATEVYEIVSEGDPDEWVTAQRVYATRRVWPES